MKKAKPAKRKAAPKLHGDPNGIEDYLARIPESARPNFDQLRSTVRSVVPTDAKEVTSYGILAFKKDRILVWFAGFAKHCSLFPSAAIIAEFKKDLAGLTTSKGTIQFPNDKPLPIPLIKKLVKARVSQAKGK